MPKCKHCGKKFEPKYSSLQKTCSVDCSIQFARSAKGVEVIEKIQKDKDKEKKIEVTDYSKFLQRKINEIVRLIDYGLPCLATNKYPNQIHGGHVYSRGSNRSIRYNLHNIHRQSAQSNHFQADDVLMREGVIREYGENYMEFITSLKATPKLKIDNATFFDLYKKASVIALRLSKDKRIFSESERIDLRNALNLELGIYDSVYCYFEK